ncbi:NAD(P)-binding protein [bacterium]|nr:NAD(P)-binding protein [bacterium]
MNKVPEKVFDAIVVGAGISGLTLAKKLSSQVQNICILEKSKSVGGRMATRRDGEATYDHGAQFYKSHMGETGTLGDLLPQAETLRTWFQKDKYQYQVSPRGITHVAKELSQNLNIIFNEKVMSLSESSQDLISLHCESGMTYKTRTVFLSAPLPQTLDILKVSKISYPPALDSILYAKALVGLFELECEDTILEQLTYEELINENIFSVSNQQSKGVSQKLAWTVVMSPQWSSLHFDENEDEILKKMNDFFLQFLKTRANNFKILKYQLKKWRYSHPLKTHSVPFETVGASKNIFLIGDAFGGASLSGALRSSMSIFDYFSNSKERGHK